MPKSTIYSYQDLYISITSKYNPMKNVISDREQRRVDAILTQFRNSPPQGYSHINLSIKSPIQDLINNNWDREVELQNKEYDI